MPMSLKNTSFPSSSLVLVSAVQSWDDWVEILRRSETCSYFWIRNNTALKVMKDPAIWSGVFLQMLVLRENF